jgi:hypothetical protein
MTAATDATGAKDTFITQMHVAAFQEEMSNAGADWHVVT